MRSCDESAGLNSPSHRSASIELAVFQEPGHEIGDVAGIGLALVREAEQLGPALRPISGVAIEAGQEEPVRRAEQIAIESSASSSWIASCAAIVLHAHEDGPGPPVIEAEGVVLQGSGRSGRSPRSICRWSPDLIKLRHLDLLAQARSATVALVRGSKILAMSGSASPSLRTLM